MKLLIGLSYVTEEKKYNHYVNAILRAAEAQSFDIEMIYLSNEPERINEIDGIIFTGGADVEPSRYGKPELIQECKETDAKRDALEFSLAATADERKLPIFGICRGLQLLNVHYGGTLIADLTSHGLPSHSKIEGTDRQHSVHIEHGTLLRSVSRVSEGIVTSAHHQAVDVLAPGMMISSRSSDDGVVEAIEWQNKDAKPFFIAVQWHPERMDLESSLSAPLFESFLLNCALAKTVRSRLENK